MKFVPLRLAWATTIHKLQGATYGPTKPGEPPNPGTKLILNIGGVKNESRTPGLAYVAASRGNTTGKGDKLKSAIYFEGGDDFNLKRFTNMTLKADKSRKTLNCARRDNWIRHLKKNVHKGLEGQRMTEERLMEWSSEYRVDTQIYKENILTWNKN